MSWRIDLYDTATTPTSAMREAMARAEVGDDVSGEDPTVNRLEEESAALLGKAAALFTPSGTMGNLIGLMVNARPGEEVLLEAESHIMYYESGGIARVAGLMPHPIPSARGILDPEFVRAALRDSHNPHYPTTSLLCVENTHNRSGGTVTDVKVMEKLRALCDENNLRLHLDGSRIFNAAVALNTSAADLSKHADTVMFCLSKGLGAPVGSILAGEKDVIKYARRTRKLLGGGMRQAGVIAAAGLVALDNISERMERDNALARQLAQKLSQIPGILIDMAQVQTNMVMVDTEPCRLPSHELSAQLRTRGIKVSNRPPYKVRMVTHRHIDEVQVDATVEAVAEIIEQWQPDSVTVAR